MAVPSFNDFVREVTSLGKAETGFNVDNELGFSPADYTRAYGSRALDMANPFGYLGRTIARTFGADVADPFTNQDTPELPLALQLPKTLFDPHPLAEHWAQQAPEGWQRSVAEGAAQLTSPFDVGITVGTVGFGGAAAAGLRAAATKFAGAGVKNRALNLGARGAANVIEPLAATGTKSGFAKALGLELGTALAAETGIKEADRQGLPMWAALPIGLVSGGAFLGSVAGTKKIVSKFGETNNRTADQMNNVRLAPAEVPPSALPSDSDWLYIAKDMDEATSMPIEFGRAKAQGRPLGGGLSDPDEFIQLDEYTWPQVSGPFTHGKSLDELNIELEKAMDEQGKALEAKRSYTSEKAPEGATREEYLAIQQRNIDEVARLDKNVKDARAKREAVEARIFEAQDLAKAGIDPGATTGGTFNAGNEVVIPERLYGTSVRDITELGPVTRDRLEVNQAGNQVTGLKLRTLDEVKTIARKVNNILEDSLPDGRPTTFGILRNLRNTLANSIDQGSGQAYAPDSKVAALFDRIEGMIDSPPQDVLQAISYGRAVNRAGSGVRASAEGDRNVHRILDRFIKSEQEWALATKRELEFARDPQKKFLSQSTRLNPATGNLERTGADGQVTVTELNSVRDYVRNVGEMLGVSQEAQTRIEEFMVPISEFLAKGLGMSEKELTRSMLLGVRARLGREGTVTGGAESLEIAGRQGAEGGALDAVAVTRGDYVGPERSEIFSEADLTARFLPTQSLVELFSKGINEVDDIATLTHEWAHVIMTQFFHLLPQDQYDELSGLIKQQITHRRSLLYPKTKHFEYDESPDLLDTVDLVHNPFEPLHPVVRKLDVTLRDANGNPQVIESWSSQVDEAFAEVFASWMHKKVSEPRYLATFHDFFITLARTLQRLMSQLKDTSKKPGEVAGMAEGLRASDEDWFVAVERLLDDVVEDKTKPRLDRAAGELYRQTSQEKGLLEILIRADIKARLSDESVAYNHNVFNALMGSAMDGFHTTLVDIPGDNRSLWDDYTDPRAFMSKHGTAFAMGNHYRRYYDLLSQKGLVFTEAESGDKLRAQLSMASAITREISELNFEQRNSLALFWNNQAIEGSLQPLNTKETGLAAMSAFKDENGDPALFFHGGPIDIAEFRHAMTNHFGGLIGPGLYLTDGLPVSGGYATEKLADRRGWISAYHLAISDDQVMRLDSLGKSDPVSARFFDAIHSKQGTNYEEITGSDEVTRLAQANFRSALDTVSQYRHHGYENWAEASEHLSRDTYDGIGDALESAKKTGPWSHPKGGGMDWHAFTYQAAMVATRDALATISARQAGKFDNLVRELTDDIEDVASDFADLKSDIIPGIPDSMYVGGSYYRPIVGADVGDGRYGPMQERALTSLYEKGHASVWNLMKGFEEANIRAGVRADDPMGSMLREHRAEGMAERGATRSWQGFHHDTYSAMVPENADEAALMMMTAQTNERMFNSWRRTQGFATSQVDERITIIPKADLKILNDLYAETNIKALTNVGGNVMGGIQSRIVVAVGDDATINASIVKRQNRTGAPTPALDRARLSKDQFTSVPTELGKRYTDLRGRFDNAVKELVNVLKERKLLASARKIVNATLRGSGEDAKDVANKSAKKEVSTDLDVSDAQVIPGNYKGKPVRWASTVPMELDEVLGSADPLLRNADGTITDEGYMRIAAAITRRMPDLLEKSWQLVKLNDEVLQEKRRRATGKLKKIRATEKDSGVAVLKQLGALRGSMQSVGFEPMDMRLEEFVALLKYAERRFEPSEWDILNAKKALEALTGFPIGKVANPSLEPGLAPQRLQKGQIVLLEKLFGLDIAAKAAARSRQLSVREKILRALVDILNIPRILLLGGDFGGLLNQGLLFAGRPRAYLSAAGTGLRSFATANGYRESMQLIEESQYFGKFFSPKKDGGYGAYYADVDSPLSLREEQFVSEFIRRIPGIGFVYRKFERFHVALLNKIRFDMLESAYHTFVRSGASQAEIDRQMRAYANFVNIGTGRGNIWKGDELTAGLNTIFLAPRWVVSRFQVPVTVAKELGGYSINKATGRPVKNNLVAKQIAKDMVGYAALIGGVATLLSLNGFHVGTDHRKSDFLKLTKGRTNIDLTAGMGSVFRFIFKAGSISLQGATEGEPFRGQLLSATGVPYDKNLWDVTGDFLNMKFSPAVRTFDTLVTGKNFYGENVDAERAFLPTDLKAAKEWAPLWIQEVNDASEQLGTNSALSLLLPSVMGLNVSIYPDKNDLALENLGRSYTEAWPFEQEAMDLLYYQDSRFAPSEYSENNYALNSLFIDGMEKILSNPNISGAQKSYQISKRYHDLNKEKRGIRLQAFGPDDQGRDEEYPLRVAQQEFYEFKDRLYDPTEFAATNEAYEYAEAQEERYLKQLTQEEREYILANMYMIPLPAELLDLKTTKGEVPGWVKRVEQARTIQEKIVRKHGLDAAPFDPALYEETREIQRQIGGETYTQEVAIAN